MREEEKKEKLKSTIRILGKLDEKSLVIIESGAGLLLARQRMEKGDNNLKTPRKIS